MESCTNQQILNYVGLIPTAFSSFVDTLNLTALVRDLENIVAALKTCL